MGNVTTWVASRLTQYDRRLRIVDRTPEDFLVVEANDDYTFLVAVLGVQEIVQIPDVQPLFSGATKPELVVNVPSKTLWSGAAIDFVHSVPAAFGTVGDIPRAAKTKAAKFFRDKNTTFIINAMEQHSSVSTVSYVYDSMFKVDRRNGASVTVAVIVQ